MRKPFKRPLLLLLGLCAPGILGAQRWDDSLVTPSGICRVWAAVPDGSVFPADAAYNRCALDRAPVPVVNVPMPGSPVEGWWAHGSFMVVVNEDGSVDSNLTRAGSLGMDTAFYRRTLETMRRWRFLPGMRGGKPVRNGVMLQVVTSALRDDTLASHMEWSYRTGTLTDTLLGRWVREPDPEPYGEARTDSIYVAVMRRLVAMQVLTPDKHSPHCLVIVGADRSRQTRLSAIARHLVYGSTRGGAFAPTGCEADTTSIRLTLPKVYRTENDRVVLYPSGDRLLEWPRYLAGESWKEWNGRCFGTAGGRGMPRMDCEVHAGRRGGELQPVRAANPTDRNTTPSSTPGTQQLRLRITSMGAYWVDTLQRVVRGPVPRLAANAVTDSEPPCNSWEVFSTQRATGLLALHGGLDDGDLRVTPVEYRPTAPTSPEIRSGRAAPAPAKFIAFLLGDLGTRAKAPVIVRLSSCGREYVLDPARHTLVQQAHARFRVGDLRPQTRVPSPFGTQIFFRIDLGPGLSDAVPLVVVDDGGGRYSAWFARSISPSTWEFRVLFGTGYPPETLISVYLFR